MKQMNTTNKGGFLTRYLIAFCVITTGLCVAEGLLGCWLLPDSRMTFSAYLVPPAFGLITSLTGLVLESRRELSPRQMLIRLFIQWLLIEGIVFGFNLTIGNRFTPISAIIVAVEIAVIFVFVHFVIWLNELRISREFNRKLAALQSRDSQTER